MDIRLLRYFSVLADELHFGRAAARLHISQPPLSQQIRLLEEKIGAPLFIRSHHNVKLTAAGEKLKEQVPLVFEQLNRAIDLTQQVGRGHVGKLELGIISSVMVDLLLKALLRFRENYPGVEWRLHEMTPSAQISALKERRLDVCIFRLPQEDDAIRSELLQQEPIVIALPAKHRLASCDHLALGDFADDPFVAFESQRSRLAEYLLHLCTQAGFTPQVSHQVTEAQTLLALARAGFGVALLPESTSSIAPPGVVFKPLKPALPTISLYAHYRVDDASPVLAVFLKTLREVCCIETAK